MKITKSDAALIVNNLNRRQICMCCRAKNTIKAVVCRQCKRRRLRFTRTIQHKKTK